MVFKPTVIPKENHDQIFQQTNKTLSSSRKTFEAIIKRLTNPEKNTKKTNKKLDITVNAKKWEKYFTITKTEIILGKLKIPRKELTKIDFLFKEVIIVYTYNLADDLIDEYKISPTEDDFVLLSEIKFGK